MKKYLGNKRVIIFLIAPAMILISVMVLYPMLVLVVHSFTEWDGLNPATFNGISNYIKLFKDPIFYTGLKNGLIFAGLQALIQIPLATLLAFAVKHSGRIEKKFFLHFLLYSRRALNYSRLSALAVHVQRRQRPYK